jgi:hypothetical protein
MTKLYYVAPLIFEDLSSPITAGQNKFRLRAPYDGEILGSRAGPRITGHIQDAGSGAGSATEVQIRNVTTGREYLTTAAEFRVDDADANGRAVLAGGVLGMSPTFRGGDILALDVEAVPTGADSVQAAIYVTCGFWREVD